MAGTIRCSPLEVEAVARKMSVSGSVFGLSRLGRRVSVGLDAAAAAAVASATIRGLLFLRVLGQDSRRPAIMVSKKRALCSPSFIDEERLAAEGEARGCSTVVSACAAESRLLLLVCSEAPAFVLSFMMDIVLAARMAPTQAPKAVVLPIATLLCVGRNTVVICASRSTLSAGCDAPVASLSILPQSSSVACFEAPPR